MSTMKRYRTVVFDSARWEGFRFRGGDIVISTPPKCGTTWMQTCCAMLVLDTVQFDRPLARISPWLDMQTNARSDVVENLEAQSHRRIIKTHTPLDGLPFDERVTYLCVGRDPRDVALSFEHHMANLDWQAFMTARAAAVGLEDLEDFGPPPGPPSPDPLARFWQWCSGDGGNGSVTLSTILRHLQTFWDRRDDPNIALFHYSDLLADLPGQFRRLAEVLAIQITDSRVEEFAAAATYDSMRRRADDLVPDVDNRIWLSNRDFFHRGRDKQWTELLDPPALSRYERRVAELVEPDLAAWAHAGTRPTGSHPGFALA
ncbi:MAG TPA: sulfotransferase domain-containing protein [Dermatophilaceae bacterium]|nr:sulfotransferase domain-containing protein [Dermatophilaceae bacterium]